MDSHQIRNLLAPRSDDALLLYDIRPPVIVRGVGTAQDLLHLGYLGFFPVYLSERGGGGGGRREGGEGVLRKKEPNSALKRGNIHK